MADKKEPTTGVLVKLPDSKIAQIDDIADIFGITRARFVAWGAEVAIERCMAKLDQMRDARDGLPGIPVSAINELLR